MKKSIKILALILAVLTLTLTCVSCGSADKNNEEKSDDDTVKISKEEMAETIRKDMKITYSYIYTDKSGEISDYEFREYGGPELFNPDGDWLTSCNYYENSQKPETLKKDYEVLIDEDKKEITVNLYAYGQRISAGRYNGHDQFEIILPYKIKSANCGKISEDKTTLAIDFYTEDIQKIETIVETLGDNPEYTYQRAHYDITAQIIIKY